MDFAAADAARIPGAAFFCEAGAQNRPRKEGTDLSKMEALLKYQQADVKADKIERDLRNSEASKRLVKVRQFLEDQKRVLQRMMASVDVRRKAIESTAQRFDVYEKRYEEGMEKYEKADKENLEEMAKYTRYFDQLTARIAQERKEFAQLVHTLEKENNQLADMRIRIAKARKEYDDLKAAVEAERAAAQGDIEAARAEANALAKDVDSALLEAYTRVKRNHAVPVAEVQQNKCTGCNMELPAVVARRLRESEVVECDNCGRILYVKAEA